MFERLFEFLSNFIGLFKFGVTIDQFERGVVLRLGVLHRILEPGFHFYYPFLIEKVITDTVVTRTNNTDSMSLQTKDEKSIQMSVVIRWKIVDIEKAMLYVEDVDHAYRDIAYGRVAEVIPQYTWEELRAPDFKDILLKACRKAGWKYGIEVEEVLFQDLTQTIPITLFNVK